jgi:hypothetical protein
LTRENSSMNEIVAAGSTASTNGSETLWGAITHMPVRLHVAVLPRYYNQTLVIRRYCECKICLKKFSSSKALQSHKFEMHSY